MLTEEVLGENHGKTQHFWFALWVIFFYFWPFLRDVLGGGRTKGKRSFYGLIFIFSRLLKKILAY